MCSRPSPAASTQHLAASRRSLGFTALHIDFLRSRSGVMSAKADGAQMNGGDDFEEDDDAQAEQEAEDSFNQQHDADDNDEDVDSFDDEMKDEDDSAAAVSASSPSLAFGQTAERKEAEYECLDEAGLQAHMNRLVADVAAVIHESKDKAALLLRTQGSDRQRRISLRLSAASLLTDWPSVLLSPSSAGTRRSSLLRISRIRQGC
jgi:hypothetical protein